MLINRKRRNLTACDGFSTEEIKVILKPILIADKEVAKLYQTDCIIEHMVTSNKKENNDDVMIMIHKPPKKIRKLRNTSTV